MKKLGLFIVEILVGAVLSLAVVAWCDARRVFAGDESNNHTGKSWHYLYKYAREHRNMDVLVLGNSHAYTGLLPEKMAEQLGKDCFILASQGTYMVDAYYMLEEALTLCKPKLVVVETYLLSSIVQHQMNPGDLNCQFQSFENRCNTWLKLRSTPRLFTVDSAPYAWSQTLRNHSYLFDDPQLIKYNLAHPKGPVYKDKTYFGRFIRFTSGLTEPTLQRYRQEGAPVDGAEMKVGRDAARALLKLCDLCREKGIPLMFLTIPMYREHVANPEQLHRNLSPYLEGYPWLDLQQAGFFPYFGPECFEDTYKANQHLSATGALRSSILLSNFIKGNEFL